MSSLLDMALRFAAHDFPVGPLCRPTPTGCSYSTHAKKAPCKYPGKAPIPYAGVRGFTTDPAKIRQFFTWYPDANLGVAMGGTYFVIEADGPEGAAWVQRFHLPPTPTVLSRRGFHAYLRDPTWGVENDSCKIPDGSLNALTNIGLSSAPCVGYSGSNF